MAGDQTASMFAGQPQPVEIHHRGIWYSGELIGWRHESNGRVAARVRCVVDGLRHSTWKDLAELRLPDPKNPPRREPFPTAVRRTVAGTLDEDRDEATRPHALLAGMRTRPAKPAHASTPPSPRVEERADPGRRSEAEAPPIRTLDRHSAYLSVV